MKKLLFSLSAVVLFAIAAIVWLLTPATTVPTFTAAKQAARQVALDVKLCFLQYVAAYRVATSPWSQAFQSTIRSELGFGLVGEILFDGPTRAQPGVIKGTQANCIIGRAFTIDTADGQFSPGGTGVFGGILANPKTQVSFGTTAGGALAPTLVVPVGEVGEFVTMGYLCVALANAATIGNGVFFTNATGVLSAGTAGAGETQIAGAQVVRYTNAAAGLACISLSGA